MSNITFKPFLDKMGNEYAEKYKAPYGELFYDPDTAILRIGDGVTPGGVPINLNPINLTGSMSPTETPYTNSEINDAIAAAIASAIAAFSATLYV